MRDIGTMENLLAEIAARGRGQKRVIVGIAGCPGSGKSTLAQHIVDAFGAQAQLLPMDGFHLAQSVLASLGLENRKGAPETFDSAGFLSLLSRVASQASYEAIYAPRFDRNIEEPIACALPIRPETTVVIVEGNYLLLDDAAWRPIRSFLDVACYLSVDNDLRESRLLRRHMEFGRTRAEALAWMDAVDNPNAVRIEDSKANANFVLEISSKH
jgi:pantothenate kinase